MPSNPTMAELLAHPLPRQDMGSIIAKLRASTVPLTADDLADLQREDAAFNSHLADNWPYDAQPDDFVATEERRRRRSAAGMQW